LPFSLEGIDSNSVNDNNNNKGEITMTIETMNREFRYDNLRLPDPNPSLTVEEVRTAFAATYPEIVTAAITGPEAVGNKLVYHFAKAIRNQRMTKAAVIRELARIQEKNAGRTSEALREFKTCPQFRQCCHILARALQRDTYGRGRSALKVPAGLVLPG
jgi:PRTRC genetic system protein C